VEPLPPPSLPLMSKQDQVVDPEALRRVEGVYRMRLLSDPCDTLARGRLAWCLFLQSLHRAGEERILNALRGSKVTFASGPLPMPFGPEAQELLEECLRQTEAVLHLSEPGEQRMEMERLLGLARLSVGNGAYRAAEDKAHRILDSLIQDLGGAGDPLGSP
jgi:hypothetical protein